MVKSKRILVEMYKNNMAKSKKIPDNQIEFYQSQDGSVNIEVLYAEENIWLTQKKMAELLDSGVPDGTSSLEEYYVRVVNSYEYCC